MRNPFENHADNIPLLGRGPVQNLTRPPSGPISDNRVSILMESPVLEWLTHEAWFFGISVPALIRQKLHKLWEDLPQDWKERLKK